MKFLASREYSVLELKKKLQKKFSEKNDDIEKILQFLISKKFLSDQRFAEIFLDSLLQNSPGGKIFLEKKMKLRGISPEIYEKIFTEKKIFETEKIRAKKLAEKKLNFLLSLDKKKKEEKIYRFLISRGFSFQIAREVLDEIF